MRLCIRALGSISLALTPFVVACDSGRHPFYRWRPLTVVETTPAADSVGVSRTGLVTAWLSDAVIVASVNATSFRFVGPDGSPVDGTISAAGGAVGFLPTTPLEYETTYTATITTDIEDYQGQRLAQPFSWSFTTVTDIPKVRLTSPAAGASNVARTATISAMFSELMATATFTAENVVVTNAAGAVVPGTIARAGMQLTFTPSAVLDALMTYTVRLSTGIKDFQLNPLAQEYTWSFTTSVDQP